ncbi:MAG TPA: hypothetical protein VLM40_09845 [Gemmata sp.]|nr:hypothetical protein [Gemmata sp.]
MQWRWLIGTLAIAAGTLATHGHPPSQEVKEALPFQATEAEKTVPEELDTLNRASRKLYAGGRTIELSTIPVVIIVSGDELVLRKNGNRTVATVIPAEYHALKCVAHSALAVFAHLAHAPGKPFGGEREQALKEYRDLLSASLPAIEKFGFDPDTLARQKRIVARGLAFIDVVLKERQISFEGLTKYCRESRADVMANCAAAARAQLLATHRQVMAWKKELTAEEWAALAVIVQGAQTPRVENAAVQYFVRLLGERGEGGRVVYAEGLWDEEKAVNLLGTRRLDGKLAIAVFNDPNRMYRDILADAARVAVDDILAAP